MTNPRRDPAAPPGEASVPAAPAAAAGPADRSAPNAAPSGAQFGAQFGALCWRRKRRQVEVLLITSRDTGRWVIPKGWPIDGLGPDGSAAREAWEEAGVEGQIAGHSIGRYSYEKAPRPGGRASDRITCEVAVFPLRVARLADRFPERKQRQRKWFTLAKAATKVAEPELRQLFAAAEAMLRDTGHSDVAERPETEPGA